MRRTVVVCIALVVAACGSADSTEQTSTTSAPPTSTAATTEATEPSTTTTTAHEPTTTTAAQTTTTTIGTLFDPTFSNGPALSAGDDGEFDDTWTYAPSVVHDGSTFHMFYTAAATRNPEGVSIGYATSTDGLTFEKHDGPVFDARTNDGAVLHSPVVAIAPTGEWVMFLGERGPTFVGPRIWRAVASEPTGPWVVDDEPLIEANVGEWDEDLNPRSVVIGVDSTLLLYDGRPRRAVWTGAMVSDGDGFVRHAVDDASAPVFEPGDEGSWDQFGVGSPMLLRRAGGFEMLYLGIFDRTNQYDSAGEGLWIGLAESDDGLGWSRVGDGPALIIPGERGFPWMSALVVGDTYYVYYVLDQGSTGVAVATFTR